jgi:hypothetical protein
VFKANLYGEECVVKHYSCELRESFRREQSDPLGAFLREVAFYRNVHAMNLASRYLLAYQGAFYRKENQVLNCYIIQELAELGTLAELLASSEIESK